MSEKPLKIVAFNGSPHPKGSTTECIDLVFDILRKDGFDCEMVMLAPDQAPVTGCRGCDGCRTTQKCVRAKGRDPVNHWVEKTLEADFLILATPTHYANVSVAMKSYIDRIGWMMCRSGQLRNKFGAGITVARTSGAIGALGAINKFFGITQCHIVGSCTWNCILTIGGKEHPDEFGLNGLKNLAHNISEVMKKMHQETPHILPPPTILPFKEEEGEKKKEEKEEEKEEEEKKKKEEAKIAAEAVVGGPADAKPITVVAFNGSANVNGNCTQLINACFDELRKEGIHCEMVMIGNAPCVHSCMMCFSCTKTGQCAFGKDGDPINEWWEKAKEADGIILASPTHFANVSVEMKSFIDRIGVLTMTSQKLANKIGAGIVAVRRGGGATVYDELNKFFLFSNMHVVSSTYWNFGFGEEAGEVQRDAEGLMTVRNLGRNMAYVLKKMHPDAQFPPSLPQASSLPKTKTVDVEDLA